MLNYYVCTPEINITNIILYTNYTYIKINLKFSCKYLRVEFNIFKKAINTQNVLLSNYVINCTIICALEVFPPAWYKHLNGVQPPVSVQLPVQGQALGNLKMIEGGAFTP